MNENKTAPFQSETWLLQALDPVHIGTGGFRLGRVDLSIVREPATGLPKIPGTSLHGAIRSYAAWRNGSRRCSGVGLSTEGHCAKKECPVCFTFGFIKGTEGGNSGTVSIGDARILLLPVRSMYGPVWAGSDTGITEFLAEIPPPGGGAARTIPRLNPLETRAGADLAGKKKVNLGWLVLETGGTTEAGGWIPGLPEWISKRLVVVSEDVFGRIVNSNLEVRTSVGINPETGAADDKALFRYEALPRATVLWFSVVEDNYRGAMPEKNGWKRPLDVVKAGLEWAEYLGVGGMGTRGFGRVRAWKAVGA